METVRPVATVWDLGVRLGSELSLKQHVSKVASACLYQSGTSQTDLPMHCRGVVTEVDIGIYTPKISPSKLFMG